MSTTTTSAAQRLAAALDTQRLAASDAAEHTTRAAALDALVDWLAEDELAPYIAARLWDLAAELQHRGEPIHPRASDPATGAELYARLDDARRPGPPAHWRHVTAAQSLIGRTGEGRVAVAAD